MKWNNTIRDISLMGVYLALYIMLGMIPQVGLIYIPPVYLTTFPIIMFLIIFIHQDFKFSLFAGLAFGFTSLVMAAVRPIGSKDWLYLNPLISILPRVVWSLLAYYLLLIGPKKILQIPWLIFVIFVTYWVHALMSDFFKFMFYVWIGGYSWHNNSLLFSLGMIWAVEHFIEIGVYSATIPFIFTKSWKVFKQISIKGDILVFDFSRTIAFGEKKKRIVPPEIIKHLNKLAETKSVFIISGRKENTLKEGLTEIRYSGLIYKNGKTVEINNSKYLGYTNFPIFSRWLSLKYLSSLTNSKVSLFVTDNKSDRLSMKKEYFYSVEDRPKIYNNSKIYKFK